MRLAEVFLRLGSSLAGWMILYAHTLWLAVSARVVCGEEGAELFAVLLGLAPVTFIAGPLILVSRPLGDVHRMLRWLAVPIVLLLPFCLYAIFRVFGTVYGDGNAICGNGAVPAWQTWWAPVELAVLVFIAVLIGYTWRTSSTGR